MRTVVVALMLAACGGGAVSNVGPRVMPMLSELPTDAEKRDGILDQSRERARPENRRSLTKKQQKAETTAAVAAALIGQAFSKTKNVSIGLGGDFEEMGSVQPTPPLASKENDGSGKPPETSVPASELVPWIKLDQKSKPADSENVR